MAEASAAVLEVERASWEDSNWPAKLEAALKALRHAENTAEERRVAAARRLRVAQQSHAQQEAEVELAAHEARAKAVQMVEPLGGYSTTVPVQLQSKVEPWL